MSTTCPTPAKKRYATCEGAEFTARSIQVGVGQLLNPYLCHPGCGWWHLSKKADLTLPTDAVADPAVIQHLIALDDTGFRAVAADDARGQAERPHRIALRDPQLLIRWGKAIGSLFHEVEAQLGMRSDEGKTEWRRRAVGFKKALEVRRRECADMCAVSEKDAKAGWERYAALREDARQLELGRRKPLAEQRDQAGQAAVRRLIGAHGPEFAGYFAEECERLGISPDRRDAEEPGRHEHAA